MKSFSIKAFLLVTLALVLLINVEASENTESITSTNLRGEVSRNLEDSFAETGPYAALVRIIGLMVIFPIWAVYQTMTSFIPLVQFISYNLLWGLCAGAEGFKSVFDGVIVTGAP
eukprot:CAMPEP_0178942870 /NCGR_PEP_ID=MMETSP0789-20121207/2248_1 /TAXON_ID=3005 /ORGANISM="Rhizosolenia setigera, Strain CCMP 1694" /LENGTH=114 /DNA_ID=CAMNT_0020622355 /DNA_START=37 /DNA_END=381 /DNA_ORIENTATION=+